MPYKIKSTEVYEKKLLKFFKKHKNLLNKYDKVIHFLEIDPFYPSLRLHQFNGKLYPLCSVSIDMSYRITIEFYIEDEQIILVDIGTHDEVYK